MWFALRGLWADGPGSGGQPAAAFGSAAGAIGLATIAALVAANLVTTAGLAQSLTACFGPTPPVRFVTMLRLMAASQLVNYLPAPPGLRAGLVGRAEYLKRRHGLRRRDAGYVLAAALGLTLLTAAAVAAAPLLVVTLNARRPWAWAGGGLLLILLSVTCGRAAARLPGVGARGYGWVAWRAADLLAQAGRLAVACVMVGAPVSFGAATLMAAGAVLAKLAPLTPNGLGVSEWAVAGTAAAFSPLDAATGAAAALLDRVAEVAVSVAAGGWGLWGLRRG